MRKCLHIPSSLHGNISTYRPTDFSRSGASTVKAKQKSFPPKPIATTHSILRLQQHIGNYNLQRILSKDGESKIKISNITFLDSDKQVVKFVGVDGYVKVMRLDGDVDGNCKVDIFDLASVGLCYGCSDGKECWLECENAEIPL